MDNIKFIGWDDDSIENRRLEHDYKKYENILIPYFIKNKIMITGIEHQENYIPIINGVAVLFSQRAWGKMMANVWNTIEGHNNYNYKNFAWYLSDEMKEKYIFIRFKFMYREDE